MTSSWAAVTGKPTAVYCSDAYRYASLSGKRKTARHQAKKQGGLSARTGMDADGMR